MTGEQFDSESRRREKQTATLLPHSIEAEEGAIASFLIAPTQLGTYFRERGMTGEWFYLPAHARIYGELSAMDAEGIAIDFILLTTRLRDAGDLERCGGASNITRLFTALPTAALASQYADIIEEKFTLRQIILTCTGCITDAYERQEDVPALLNDVETRIAAIASRRNRKKRKEQSRTVLDVIEMIESDDEEKLWGIRMGFAKLDLIARGLRAGNVIGIGGDMKVGKTALAQNIIYNVSVRAPEPVHSLVISLENDAQEVNEEMMQIGTGYNLDEMRRAATREDYPHRERIMERITEIGTKLVSSPITIEDDGELNILQIRALARKLKPRIILIDYLQLVNGSQRRYERDELRIAECSRHFKLMAKELAATVIVISQLTEKYDGTKTAAGSKALLKDANQWWIVEDGEDADHKLIKVCAARRVKPETITMRWNGPAKKFLQQAD